VDIDGIIHGSLNTIDIYLALSWVLMIIHSINQ
jgi:hypothetical protein